MSTPVTRQSIFTSVQAVAADIASELRASPDNWFQDEIAADAECRGLNDARDPGAVCWCLEGHIDRRVRRQLREETYEAFRVAVGKRCLYQWNDAPDRTVDEVIALCDRVAQS